MHSFDIFNDLENRRGCLPQVSLSLSLNLAGFIKKRAKPSAILSLIIDFINIMPQIKFDLNIFITLSGNLASILVQWILN